MNITNLNPDTDIGANAWLVELEGHRLLLAAGMHPQREGREYVAPIMVGQQRLGTIRMSPDGKTGGLDETKLSQLAEKFQIDPRQLKALITQMNRAKNTRPAAIQFLFLLANAIARLCFQEYQLRQRINELTAVYNVTMMLADARDLQKVLQRTVKVVCDVMETKAASIRLVDAEKDELVIKAVHNLSQAYQTKGPVRLSSRCASSTTSRNFRGTFCSIAPPHWPSESQTKLISRGASRPRWRTSRTPEQPRSPSPRLPLTPMPILF